jgi:hypothetical protein
MAGARLRKPLTMSREARDMAAQATKPRTRAPRAKTVKTVKPRNVQIAAERLQGHTLQAIGDKHGLSPTQVCRILSDDQLQDILKAGTAKVIELVPKAIANIDRLQGSEKEEISHRASETILKTAGLTGPHASPLVTQYIQINQVNQVSAPLRALLGTLADRFTVPIEDAEVIDGSTADG